MLVLLFWDIPIVELTIYRLRDAKYYSRLRISILLIRGIPIESLYQQFPAILTMEFRVWRFQNYRDCGYTCNPHKFEIPALWFPRKDPVIPCKHLHCVVLSADMKNLNPPFELNLSKKLHCKCLLGFTGTLRGNQSAGISNLWGLHVYLQSL